MFKFSARHKEDVVTVEVWRGSKRLAQNYLVVDETPAVSSGSNRCIKIEITEIPPAEEGGAATRADIAGRVPGNITPDLRVLI